ncbi:MAG: DUF3105 domain-containing protein [Nocardioides sp.]
MTKTSRRATELARRQRAAEIQRAHQQRERRRIIVAGVVVVLVVVGIGVAVFQNLHHTKLSSTSNQIVPAAVSGPTTVQPTPERVSNPTDIKGVLAWNTAGYPAPGDSTSGTLGHDHVAGPVTYAVTPPVGGPHNPVWMNAGVYTEPVPSERAVHTLEHGAVWITYRPNLPASEVAKLVAFFDKQSMISEPSDGGRSNRFVDLSPWADNSLPSPIVISSWGYQLRVTGPTDPRLQQFVDTFRHSRTYSPEYGSPVDGVPVRAGGQPEINGSSEANPAGGLS